MNFYALTPELTGGKFFDVNNNSSGNSLLIPIGDGGNQQFGVVLSGVTGSDYFGFSQSSDLYSSTPTADAAAFKITDATFDHYLEKDASGKATGYVVIHYMGGSDYKNQADYDDAQSTP